MLWQVENRIILTFNTSSLKLLAKGALIGSDTPINQRPIVFGQVAVLHDIVKPDLCPIAKQIRRVVYIYGTRTPC
jgi:hypothetical protein